MLRSSLLFRVQENDVKKMMLEEKKKEKKMMREALLETFNYGGNSLSKSDAQGY